MKPVTVFQFQPLMSLPTNHVEASTRPKKNDHTRMGWLRSSQVMTLASENTLMPMPSRSENRKFPLIFSQKRAQWPVKKRRMLSALMLLMVSISSS